MLGKNLRKIGDKWCKVQKYIGMERNIGKIL